LRCQIRRPGIEPGTI